MKIKDFTVIRNGGALPSPHDVEVSGEGQVYLNDFLTSATFLLEELEQAALACELPDQYEENISAAKRILHTIKGEGGVVGIDDVFQICHQAEFALEENEVDKHADILLTIKDWLGKAVVYLAGGNTDIAQENACKDNLIMKTLIVEDDFASRKALQIHLSDYGCCFCAANGREAVEAFKEALDQKELYDLICMDIMMPEMNGHEALEQIRKIERERNIYGLEGVKVIMTTSLDDSKNIMGAFKEGCEAYIVKPIRKEHFFAEMKKLGLPKTENKE